MKENFDAALVCVLQHEGGYVDHPLDPGGATNRGVTRATLAGVRGRPVSKAEVMALSLAETAAIYRRLFWSAVRGDDLPAGVDLAVFDLAVNSGPRRAALALQKALGVVEDGTIGPLTLAACRSAPAGSVVAAVSELRLGFLARLPTFATFGRGWRRRVEEVRRQSLALAQASPAQGASAAAGAAAVPQVPRTTQVPALKQVSPRKKETLMTDIKSVLASRTVWANVVGLTAIGLSTAGFDTKALDVGGVVDAGLQVVAGASFIASTFFRVVASRRLVV
jgi:lysozyme family protein